MAGGERGERIHGPRTVGTTAVGPRGKAAAARGTARLHPWHPVRYRPAMPTYEYECPRCGVIEVLQSMKDPTLTVCPQCRKRKVVKLVSRGAGVIFKGDGFWETDYNRSKDYSAKQKGESAPAAPAAATPAAPTPATPAASATPAPASPAGTSKPTKTKPAKPTGK